MLGSFSMFGFIVHLAHWSNTVINGVINKQGDWNKIRASSISRLQSMGRSIHKKLEISNKLIADLINDIQSVVKLSKELLVNFIATKIKKKYLLTVWENLLCLSISMVNANLHERGCLRLSGIKFFAVMKCKAYIESIARSTPRKVGFLYRTRPYFSAKMSTIRPCVKYPRYSWSSSAVYLETFIEILWHLGFSHFNHNVASLCISYS